MDRGARSRITSIASSALSQVSIILPNSWLEQVFNDILIFQGYESLLEKI